MAQTWLPGDTRQRIQDLVKSSSITQAELAGIRTHFFSRAPCRYAHFSKHAFPLPCARWDRRR